MTLKLFLCFAQHKEPREVHMFVDLFLHEVGISVLFKSIALVLMPADLHYMI